MCECKHGMGVLTHWFMVLHACLHDPTWVQVWKVMCTVCICGLCILSMSVGLCVHGISACVYMYICIADCFMVLGMYVCLCVYMHVDIGGDGMTAGKAPSFLCTAHLGYRYKGSGPPPTPEPSMTPTDSIPAQIPGPEPRPTLCWVPTRAHRHQ